jgi:dTDP-glucose 4,6-dehydratase
MKKILILGVNSFSGSSFAKYIQSKKFKLYGFYHKEKNKKYIIYNKKKISLKKVNNLNEKLLIDLIKKIKPNIIIDFASICMVNESWKYKKYYNEVNYKSKINLIKFLSEETFLKKYIYISTPEVFGSNKNISEKTKKFSPSTPYAASKLNAEKYLNHMKKKKNFPVIICRFSNFYGPGQPIYRLIPKVCITADKHQLFPLHGGGSSKRNFLFSDDFCNGIYKTVQKGKTGQVYHFSGDEIISIKDIVKKIYKIKKKKFDKLVENTKDRVKKDKIYSLSSKITQKSLNWRCKTSLEKGLNKTINFYKKNFSYFKYEKSYYKFRQ